MKTEGILYKNICIRDISIKYWLKGRYDTLTQGILIDSGEKIYLGKKKNRVCRYCGEINIKFFKKEAHAFPEFLGNKILIDYNECDNCNELFARTLEDNLGKWTLPWRNLGRFNGKKGFSSYKDNQETFRIDPQTESHLNIYSEDINRYIKFHHENNSATITYTRQKYIPLSVFKCFIKMAIAITPETHEKFINPLKPWILGKITALNGWDKFSIIHTKASGPITNKVILYSILKRKLDIKSNNPFLVFIITVSNHQFQIIIPFSEKTTESSATSDVQILEFPILPHFLSNAQNEVKFGPQLTDGLDMTENRVIENEKVEVKIKFEKHEDLPELKGIDPKELKNKEFIKELINKKR